MRPLFRRISERYVARRIESNITGIHNRVVSCIDIDSRSRAEAKTVSSAFYHRLVHEAIERIRSFKPSTVIDFPSLRRSTILAGATALSFVVALGLFSDRLPRAMARIFKPFADIPPASGVVYEVTPGSAKILRGDDLQFTATVLSEKDPERLWLELISGEDGKLGVTGAPATMPESIEDPEQEEDRENLWSRAEPP